MTGPTGAPPIPDDPAIPDDQAIPADPGALEIRAAWRLDDPQIEADAIEFWKRLDLLPPSVDPKRRAKDLIAAAYRDGKLIAVSTATVEWFEHLRARFAVLRGATDPEHRRSRAQLDLALPSRQALQRWAREHPEEKLAGGLAFVEAAEWGDFATIPVWPESELTLIGWATDGRQVRVAWFDDYRLD
jgi:hypothetical protein